MAKPLFALWLLAVVVSLSASVVVGQTPKPSSAAIDALIAELDDPREPVRVQAAHSLAGMGPAAEPAIPALVQMLGAQSNVERLAATIVLARIGPAAKPAIPALREAAASGDDNVKRAVASAIEAIDPSFFTLALRYLKSPYVLTALLALGAGVIALIVLGGARRGTKIPEVKWKQEQTEAKARAMAAATARKPKQGSPEAVEVEEPGTPSQATAPVRTPSLDRGAKPRTRVSRPLPGFGNYVKEQLEGPESIKRDFAREQEELKRIMSQQEELADQYDMEDPKKDPERAQGLRRQIEELAIEHYRTEVRVKALEIKVVEALLGDGKTADPELRARTEAMLREKWDALRLLLETPSKIVYRLGQWASVPIGQTGPVADVRSKIYEFGIVIPERAGGEPVATAPPGEAVVTDESGGDARNASAAEPAAPGGSPSVHVPSESPHASPGKAREAEPTDPPNDPSEDSASA